MAQVCILGAFLFVCRCRFVFSGVTFLFCFVFVFLLFSFIESARPFAQSFFDMHAPRWPRAVSQQVSVSYFVLFYFCFLGDVFFFRALCTIAVSFLHLESTLYLIPCTLYVFLLDDVFLPCDHGLDFDITNLLCKNSTNNQSIRSINQCTAC